MRTKALCLVLVWLLCSYLFNYLYTAGWIGDDEDSEIVVPDYDEHTEMAFDERGLQPAMDVYIYLNDGEITKIESCSFFSEFTSVIEPIVAEGIMTTPYNGLIEEEGGLFAVFADPNIIRPSDYQGDFAVFYLDESFYYGVKAESTQFSAWALAEKRGASAIIYSEYVAFDSSSDRYNDIVEISDCASIQWRDYSGLDYQELVTIPVVVISPNIMRILQQSPMFHLEIGPEGFEPKGITSSNVSTIESVSLPSKKVKTWEKQHQDCPPEFAGAMVEILFEDLNQDGEFQTSEQSLVIECLNQSPYTDGITSISLERNEIEVPTTECVSGIAVRFDVITTRESGMVTTELGSDTGCAGTTPESFENQLKRLLCENGHLPDETTLSEMTLSSCLSPLYENELRLVIPQLKVDSLTQSQMPTCANGGLLITMWADADGNGAWDQSETQSTQRLCNGTDGIDGENGSDGQDGENGLDAYQLLVETHNADENSCPLLVTGKEVFLGRDINSNGVLDNTEIEHSYAICNGVDGSNGTNGQTALLDTDIISNDSATDCNGVYVRLSNGFDLNNDSNLSIEETRGSRYICLPSHQTDVNATFVKESIQPNSVCLNGGVHSFIWIDEDGNDARTPEEIFMETFDCASDETVVQCNDADGDCISDEDDMNEENDRENVGDSDFDGTPDDEDDYPECDNRFDSDADGIPDDCDDDI